MSRTRKAKASKPRCQPQPQTAALFAGNLQRVRNALGISQEQLSQNAGMHRTAVGAFERGERSNPTLGVMDALARAADVDIRVFLQPFDPKAPEPLPTAG